MTETRSVAGFRVREARAEDLDAVAVIEAESFSDPWSADAFASSLALPQARFYLAEEGGGSGTEEGHVAGVSRLLGYVVALTVGEEGEVANLAVAPAARRRGVGGVLLDRFIAEAELAGVLVLFLEVRESNVAARRLYESRGFVQVGRRRGYYRTPDEDALVLRRDSAPA